MTKRRVSSGSQYEQSIGFSRAVRVGSTIAVSGTAPLGPDGRTAHPGDVYAQTVQCLHIGLRALREAGATPDAVIRTRIFLTDISRWQEAARAHGETFGAIRPASTFVGVAALIDPDWLVEIELDAIAD